MELVSQVVTVPTDHTPLTLFFLGDIHFGTRACDRGTLERNVEMIRKTPNSYVIGMGDFCECIIPTDRKRWEIAQLDPALLDWVVAKQTDDIIDWQVQQAVRALKPLKGRIIGLLCGNHEHNLARLTNRDIVPHIAEQLGTRYFGWSAYIRLSVSCKNGPHAVIPMKVFHGNVGGKTPAPKFNELMRTLEYWHVRILVMAHSHTLETKKLPGMRLTDRGPVSLVQFTRVVGVSGSFYRAYMPGPGFTYAEEANYPPSLLGCLRVTYKLYGDELDIHG